MVQWAGLSKTNQFKGSEKNSNQPKYQGVNCFLLDLNKSLFSSPAPYRAGLLLGSSSWG